MRILVFTPSTPPVMNGASSIGSWVLVRSSLLTPYFPVASETPFGCGTGVHSVGLGAATVLAAYNSQPPMEMGSGERMVAVNDIAVGVLRKLEGGMTVGEVLAMPDSEVLALAE